MVSSDADDNEVPGAETPADAAPADAAPAGPLGASTGAGADAVPPPPWHPAAGGHPVHPYGVPMSGWPMSPPTNAPYPYGMPQPHHASPPARSKQAVLSIVAVVIALIAAAAAGAGVEYALIHGSTPSTTTPTTTLPNINVSAIAARVDPALVDIDTTLAQGGAAAGTGMVLTSSGLVLTNNHVIENATTINARSVEGGRTYSATVLGYSVTDDVALLQLKGASGLKAITTGSSSHVTVGQPIVAIGNAGGTGGTPTAVAGTVTALDQTITAGGDGTQSETLQGMIEVDAPIVPGDSGGPLVDTSAQVIGMDTAASVVSGGGFGAQSDTGQGYAIPIEQALSIIHQIEAGQSSATVQIGPRALLGVEVTDGVSPPGAYVDGVESASPASSAGIRPGDTIVSVGATAISSASDLSNALMNDKPGASVTVGWVDSSGASHSAVVTLTTGPPA